MNEEKLVEVVMRVPKKLMDFLEEEEFFGWCRDDFFLKSIRESISTELNSLDFDKMRQLELRYGDELTLVRSRKTLV